MAVSVLSEILQTQIVAITTRSKSKGCVTHCSGFNRRWSDSLEITLNSPKALSVIEEAAQQLGDKALIGAGTVLDAEIGKRSNCCRSKIYHFSYCRCRDNKNDERVRHR